jgi:hypothetical protein
MPELEVVDINLEEMSIAPAKQVLQKLLYHNCNITAPLL